MSDVAEAGAEAHDPTVAINEGDPGDLVAEAQETVARLEGKVEKERSALADAEAALATAQADLAELGG